MKNCLLLVLFLLGSSASFASIRYWVGGNGNWSDNATHWSLTSGGTGGAAVPTAADSVILDAASGLNSTSDTVVFDTPVFTLYFDYSGVGNAFTFGGTEPSIEINGSFIANGSANYFWTGEIHLKSALTGSVLTSTGSAWMNDFKITGAESITLSDDFNSTADMYVDNGGLICSSLNFTSKDFWATVANTRSIDFSGSTINITGINWSIDNTTLTWLSANTQINLTNTGTFTFVGGDISYDTVVSSSLNFNVNDDNGFALLQLANSSILSLSVGSTQTINSLITSGNCGANTSIVSSIPGTSASIIKTGSDLFDSNLTISDVDATGPATYNVSSSDTTNSVGWTILNDFYWIGGTGNWSDGANWSSTSGGAAIGCYPQTPDNAIFDDNSGLLSIAQTVTMDIAVTIHDYDFSAVSTPFTLSSALPSIEVQGSLSANGLADIVWNGVINLNPLTSELLTSNGQGWNNNFFKIGADSIDIVDHLITIGDLIVDEGVLSCNDTITCANFFSNTANSRSIDFDSIYFNLQDSVWSVNPNSLTWTSLTSTINLNKLDSVYFNGGNLLYDTVRVNTNELVVYGNNTFSLVSLAMNSNLALDNGSIQNIDSLETQGACGSDTRIHSLNDTLASAQINKTGNPLLFLSNVNINNVDATAPAIYNIQLSDTINGAEGWNQIGTTYFWINDGGSWSDTSQWSFSTGGPIAGCSPGLPDFVVFDDLSFTTAGEVVLVDSLASFTSMDWSTVLFPATLDLDTNIESYGNVTFYNDLFVTRDSTQHILKFMNQSDFSPDSALVDCNIGVFIPLTDSLSLFSDLIMTDSTAIVLFGGRTYSQGNYIRTGSILSIDNPLNPLDARLLDFGSSTVDIIRNFDSELDVAFTFNGGTSNVTIADTSAYINRLKTGGLSFYNVTLDFQPLTTNLPNPGTPLIQQVTGSNTFNKLTILKGSSVYFESGSTQTINDSLVIVGNCQDSIYISTTDTIGFTAANFNKIITTDISIQCVDISGITNSSGNLTALFSTDNISNTNWTFDTTPSITAGFLPNGPYCFGDTTLFTETTSTFPTPTSYTSQWYYNDATTGFFIYPSTGDSVFINYEVDTLQHIFGLAGAINVQLITIAENYCTDTTAQLVQINNPIVALITSESDTTLCEGDSIAFSAIGLSPGMDFEFFLNGTSLNTASPTDTLYTSTTLVTGDQVGLLGYQNGCVTDDTTIFEYTVTPVPSYSWNYSSGLTICDGDSVAFNVIPTNIADTSHFTYQFLINSNSVAFTSEGFYTSDTLNNNDIVSVIVKDSLSCQDSSAYIFTVNPTPTTVLAQSITGNVICTGDLVTFTGSGASTYEFFVDNVSQGAPGGNTWSTTSLASGDTVSVIGYSTLGCPREASEFYFYLVNPLPNTNVSVSTTDTICSGDLVTLNASGASLYEFFINSTSQGAPSSTSFFNTSGLTNNDTVYVTGQFSGCTASSDSTIFTVFTSPATGLISDLGNNICQEDLVTFTASGAANYQFFIDGILQGPPSTSPIFSSNSIANGQIVSVNGESNTCIIQQGILFTVLGIPSVGLFSDDPNNIICDGEALTLTGANANSFDLYINGVISISQTSPTFINPSIPVGTNSIYLIGTGANGCADTTQTILSIIVNPIPTVNLASSDLDNIICSGDSVTFTGTGSDNYQFFVDGAPLGSMSPTDSLTTTNLLNGQVIQILGSSIGCTNTSGTITMTVNAIPATTLASTDINNVYCEDESVDYTAGGATNYEFIVNGVSQGPSSPSNTVNSLSFPTGSYSVQVIGEVNNCSNTAVNMITINALPIASLVSSDLDNIICTNESVTYTASGGTLYEFFLNGTPQGASPVNTFTTTTLVNSDVVSLNVSSSAGCVSSDVYAAVTVNPTPTISLINSDPDTTICLGDIVTFNATGATDYEFFIAGTSQGSPSPTSTISTTGLVNGGIIEVLGSTLGCLSTSNNFSFTVYGYPVVTLTNNSDTTICTGELTDLVAGGATNYQFSVNSTPTGAFAPITAFNTSLSNGDIVTVEGETNGCASPSSAAVTYLVNTFPTLTSVSTGTIICLNDTVSFNASGAMTYDFNLNGTTIQSGATSTLVISYLVDGDILTITGYNGDCASNVELYNFTVNSMNLDLTVAPSSMICEGESVTFEATGAAEYEFFINGISQGVLSPTNTFNSTSLNDLDEVTFTGYSTSTLCTQSYDDYILMNVIDEPSIIPLSNTIFCEGDSVILLSSLEYGNQWYQDGIIIPGATDTSYTTFVSGTYSLDVISGGTADVWSFGQNATGTFGNGSNLNSPEPTAAVTTELFDQLSAGYDFLLGVTSTNEVFAWGENNSGQLGDGTFTSSSTPQLVPSLANIKTVATAESSSMAVDATGNTFVWGNNNIGQLATGNTSVVNFPFANPSLTNIDSIAGGKNHFVILRNDGTVWTVGNNNNGQLGQGNLTNSMNAVQVPGLANIVSIGAGEYQSFAIDNNGDLYVWGNNGSGQLGLNDLTNRLNPTLSPLKNVINAQGGAAHSAFLTSNEKVFVAGDNTFGQLGTGNFTSSTAAIQVAVSGADMISTGQYTTLVKRSDMSVFGFGNNTEDQLSLTGLSINTPEHITDLDGVTFIEAGKSTSHVIYSTTKTCSSQDVDLNMLTTPLITISAVDDLLSTMAGTSYQWYFNGNPIPGETSQTMIATQTGDYTVEVTFANGCTGISQVYFFSMVSIENLSFENVNVFPNPTNDLINIQLTQELSELTHIEIRDQAGRLVKEIEFNDGNLLTINVSELENGIYHLLIQNESASGNMHFVKSPK